MNITFELDERWTKNLALAYKHFQETLAKHPDYNGSIQNIHDFAKLMTTSRLEAYGIDCDLDFIDNPDLHEIVKKIDNDEFVTPGN